MTGENTAVVGIYGSYALTERAVHTLREAGFRSTDISIMFPENVATRALMHHKGSKAPEGAVTGASTGAIVGGAVGWLAGIGALAVPGVGPFIAAGPMMTALAGAGVGGAVGGLTGALAGMGVPEYEAKHYEGRVYKGGILLAVHCDDSEWTRKAEQLLERTGADDVSSSEATNEAQDTGTPLYRDVM